MPQGDDERAIGGLGEARRIQQAGPGSGRAKKRSAEHPDLPGVRAAGFRYLLGLVKVGVAQAAELSDRDRPKWLRIEDSFSRRAHVPSPGGNR